MKKVKDEGFNENVQELPLPWIGVSHGLDNYDQGMDLSKILAFSSSFEWLGSVWDVKVTCYVAGWHEPLKLHLNPNGYDAFLRGLAMTSQGVTGMSPTSTVQARDNARQLSVSARFRIFERDEYRCQVCGKSAKEGATLEVDHKVPKAKGGTDDEANLWTLCFECNRGKRDRLCNGIS